MDSMFSHAYGLFARRLAFITLAKPLFKMLQWTQSSESSLRTEARRQSNLAETPKPLNMLFFFVSGSRSLYGTETRFIAMIDAFQRNGARVLAIESYPSLKRISGKVAYPCREVSVIVSRKRKFSTSGLNLLRIMFSGIQACLSNRQFDLIISSERNFMNVLPAFAISRLIRKPLVIVIHHAVAEDYVSRKESFSQTRTNGLLNGLLLTWGKQLQGHVCRRAELVIAISEATKREFCSAYGILPQRVVVTGNGARIKANPTSRTRMRTVDVAYLGRFTSSKGAFLLPVIWKMVVQKRPGSRLVIAGGNASEVAELLDSVRALRLQEEVDVFGYLSDNEASELLATAKIFVLPSTKEGFSIATADAMSSGCSCIVSDLPALRDVFQDSAIYVPVGDVAAFATAIVSTLDNEALRKDLSARGIEFAQRFSWDSIAKSELVIYEALATRYRSQ